MLEIKHIERFIQKFNDIVEKFTDNIDEEDRAYLDHWQAYLAMAIMDDLGRETANDVANIIETMYLCNS